MEIIALKEGLFSVDQSKKFLPFNPELDKLSERNVGSFVLGVSPFLVKTASDLIVLDAGLGYEMNDRLQIEQLILDAGFLVEDVTLVLMSHLHKDHIGGLIRKNVHGEIFTPFVNAKIYIQERELEYALSQQSHSFDQERITAIKLLPNLVLMQEDAGLINENVRFELTGAHSPFHQVFWVEEDGETAFYGADVAPQLFQLKNKIVAKYDFDGKKAMQYRQDWLAEGTADDWTFLFYHDVKNNIWRAE